MLSAMDQNTTAVERAFQLAKSGDYATVGDVVKQLKVEQYLVGQITGGALRAQLAALIKAARNATPSHAP